MNASSDVVDGLKADAIATVAGFADDLISVSHSLWERPELAFEEHHAHDVLTDALEAAGFDTTRHAFGLETAFVGRWGRPESVGPTLAVICEYDALPEIGHACGHNIIAAAGLGAALSARDAVDRLDGTLVVLGTPAEEGGGGKIHMIENGAFDGIDAAMMIHPADADLDAFWAIAVQQLMVSYRGRAAHAAAAPQEGVNALDAAVAGYMNLAMLRQHIGRDERLHGVFVDGGDKPNVVPHRASMHWFVRSGTQESLETLKPRVESALTAGATATGCDVDIEWLGRPYADLVTNVGLDRLFASNLAVTGRDIRSRDTAPSFLGSTDMGNVSHLVPSLHPMIAAAPPGTAIHTSDFAAHAGGEMGDRAVIDGATAMALTMIDVWATPGTLHGE